MNEIVKMDIVTNIPVAVRGYALRSGEISLGVYMMQKYLSEIAQSNPCLRPIPIDGNYGTTAAMAECLAQVSYDGVNPQAVSLLPALPPNWQSGAVQGLCLPGGACLDLVWENGTLQTAALHAAAPWKMRLHCAGAEAEIELSARQSVTLNAALQPIH